MKKLMMLVLLVVCLVACESPTQSADEALQGRWQITEIDNEQSKHIITIGVKGNAVFMRWEKYPDVEDVYVGQWNYVNQITEYDLMIPFFTYYHKGSGYIGETDVVIGLTDNNTLYFSYMRIYTNGNYVSNTYFGKRI